jgi:hypothetical protein
MADMMRRPEPERNRQSGALPLALSTRSQMGTISGHSQPAFDPAAQAVASTLSSVFLVLNVFDGLASAMRSEAGEAMQG